jgi:acyl carrier protein
VTENLEALLVSLILEIAPEVTADDIDPTDDLRDQLDLDSMDLLNLMVKIRDRIGVEIPEADYSQLSTIEGAVKYLQERTKA